jgi:hypothetical protein
MKLKRDNKLICVAVIAAFVAALTTISIILLRMRAKRKALDYYGDTIDYDLDDCCCDEYDENVEDIETEEPVQIPLADTDDEDIEIEI